MTDHRRSFQTNRRSFFFFVNVQSNVVQSMAPTRRRGVEREGREIKLVVRLTIYDTMKIIVAEIMAAVRM